PEFDYPAAEENVFTTYAGSGGMPLGPRLTRAAIAMHLGSIKILLSDNFGGESARLLPRRIRERAQRIAPFLLYDRDPYLVVRRDGTLTWILDAYTASDSYPYAELVETKGLAFPRLNYIRNSVKVTIDAYDGAVHFYSMDMHDPLLRTWKGV